MSLFVQASMLTDDGDSKNTVVNTFAFDGLTTADATAALTAVDNFYGTVPTSQTVTVSSFFSPYLQQSSGLLLKVWDLTGHEDGSTMGTPYAELLTSLSTPQTGEPMPSHTACVVTLEGTGRAAAPVEIPGSPPRVRPKSRRTGRIYIGPVNVSASEPTSFGDARPSVTFQAVLCAAITDLNDEAIAAGGALAVWSRSNSATYPLEAVSVDDAWDVVKTRKRATTSRTRVLL